MGIRALRQRGRWFVSGSGKRGGSDIEPSPVFSCLDALASARAHAEPPGASTRKWRRRLGTRRGLVVVFDFVRHGASSLDLPRGLASRSRGGHRARQVELGDRQSRSDPHCIGDAGPVLRPAAKNRGAKASHVRGATAGTRRGQKKGPLRRAGPQGEGCGGRTANSRRRSEERRGISRRAAEGPAAGSGWPGRARRRRPASRCCSWSSRPSPRPRPRRESESWRR